MARLLRLLGRIALVALGVTALVIVGLLLTARPAPVHPFFSTFTRFPLIIAHADDTGNGLWPGNTMPFLEGVAGLGVDILEMDVTMTRDGMIVLMHDTTVDRTTDGAGRVSDLAFAELRQLEVGVNWTQDEGRTYPYRGQGLRVPTLEEVFARFPGYPMNIEIKQETPSMAAPLCDLIRRSDRQNTVLVASFSDAAMGEFRAACPEVATAASRRDVTAFVLLNFAWLADTITPAYAAHQVPMRSGDIPVVTQGFVDAAGRRNLQVHVWTVNDPDQMRRLIEMGVDGIMTDRPDVLAELLGR
jgi:glycerophosphoryl diester phosphodiesterase